MDENEFAKSLLAHERKEWQDPQKIVTEIGVKEGMTVADLACGPGFFVVPLAKAVGEKGRIYAVDKSQVMLEYLKSNIARTKTNAEIVKIIEADVSKTSIPSSSCDIVFFANILHDLDNPEAFLNEAKRISKPHAILVDIDWKDVNNGFGPPLEVRMSETKAKTILADNGLFIQSNIDAGPYHYGFILKTVEKIEG
jgi:ubiquinone/menaquinone biosynthesis C-methylase UbiE